MSSYPPPDSWPPQPTGGSGAEAVTPDDRNWGVVAHLASPVSAWFALGLIAPLIVLLARGGNSPWLRRHAVESLNFQLNAAVYAIICWILVFTIVGIPLALAYLAFYLICVLLGSVRASQGRDFRYPLTIRLIT